MWSFVRLEYLLYVVWENVYLEEVFYSGVG